MRYHLSRIVPVRFRSIYGVEIPEADIAEGGHGNHYRGDTHFDAEHCSWWQFRGHIWRRRTLRICLPA
jgi:hypothetical protein